MEYEELRKAIAAEKIIILEAIDLIKKDQEKFNSEVLEKLIESEESLEKLVNLCYVAAYGNEAYFLNYVLFYFLNHHQDILSMVIDKIYRTLLREGRGDLEIAINKFIAFLPTPEDKKRFLALLIEETSDIYLERENNSLRLIFSFVKRYIKLNK